MAHISSSSFYMTLPSNVGGVENKTGEYTVALPSTLSLDSNFEVALAEFVYPHTFKNVTNMWEAESHQNVSSVFVQHERGMICFEIPEAHYDNGADLCKVVNKAMRGARINIQDKKNNYTGKGEPFDLAVSMKFKYDNVYKKIKLVYGEKGWEQLRLLGLSKHIAYMMGFESRFIELSGDHIRRRHDGRPPVLWSDYMLDLTAGLSVMYIYADIVKPQFVGDTRVPLIRAVPVSGSSGDIVRESFLSRQYVDVQVTDITYITISIKTDRGKTIPFDYGKCLAVLHFRRKKHMLF